MLRLRLEIISHVSSELHHWWSVLLYCDMRYYFTKIYEVGIQQRQTEQGQNQFLFPEQTKIDQAAITHQSYWIVIPHPMVGFCWSKVCHLFCYFYPKFPMFSPLFGKYCITQKLPSCCYCIMCSVSTNFYCIISFHRSSRKSIFWFLVLFHYGKGRLIELY